MGWIHVGTRLSGIRKIQGATDYTPLKKAVSDFDVGRKEFHTARFYGPTSHVAFEIGLAGHYSLEAGTLPQKDGENAESSGSYGRYG